MAASPVNKPSFPASTRPAFTGRCSGLALSPAAAVGRIIHDGLAIRERENVKAPALRASFPDLRSGCFLFDDNHLRLAALPGSGAPG